VLATDLNFELVSNSSAPRLGREALLPLAGLLTKEQFSDLTLVVSELTANAVKFGPGSPIEVSVAIADDGAAHGYVDDGGSGGVEITPAEPSAATGLGLLIVDTLATSWGVKPDSTRVWFELPASTRTAAPGRAP
jgi:anti-sigma regulatory factor (Ser/Thr protein kinase)